MQPAVYIIILNWNGLRDTIRCVTSLEQQTYANYKILIVDNGSTDDSVDALRDLGSRVHLIESPTNLGYVGGNNLAMREAFDRGADYVWLFNNDAVAEPDTLVRLVGICQANPSAGLASPLVREEDDHDAIQFACGLFDLTVPAYASTCEIEKARGWQADSPDHIALVGTAMLVRRAVFEKIGGLDDRIFAYWEDIDYSIRSALAGFRNVMVFDASIFHRSKPSIGAADSAKPYYYYFMARNEILIWRTFCPRLPFLKSIVWNLRRQLRQIQRMPNNMAGLDAVLAGLWDGWLGVGGGYNPTRRMPSPIRQLLGHHPGLWLRLLGAKW